jgi:asparagine synthase (glutamine-hydrolysing)
MCGIFGAISQSGASLRSREAVLRAGECLRHRGPDGEGNLDSRIAVLGSRRLAIIDLSTQANQPFSSPDGQVWLVCNGEIYNAPELRRRYARQGYPFRSSHSDVETLLPLFLDRGEAALDDIDGMFALALWDAGKRVLLLARDRAGEKPLHYCQRGGEIHFASEIQSLIAGLGDVPEISPAGLSDYLTLGYTTAPQTMFAGIRKLEAGHLLRADAAGVRTRPYWNACDYAVRQPASEPGRILEVFDRCVQAQTLSDVPLGAFVSGGLDSSLLVASLARNMPAEGIHTYAVQFKKASYDESDWAERVSRSFGTVHHNVTAGEEDLRRALDFISAHLAEPLGDPAILPVHLLAEAAAQDVKVVLSGEGADELFGGYPTYIGHRWAERYRALPAPVARAIAAVIHRLPVTTRKVSLSFLARRFVEEAERDPLARHLAWFGALGVEARAVGGLDRPYGPLGVWDRLAGIDEPIKRIMVFDLLTYLAENLLTKLDRATMLSSVEARAPFLGRELMELALRQPVDTAVGNLNTKIALKRAALDRLPRDIVRRRKRGLSVPIAEWLNGELRSEVDRLFDGERLRRQELVDPAPIRRLLEEHRQGRADHGRRLWPLFMLQRWHERWIETPQAWTPPCAGEQQLTAVAAGAG